MKMKCFLLFWAAFCMAAVTTAAVHADILFDYTVQVDGSGPLIPVAYPQSSGVAGTLEVMGLAGVSMNASGLGTDIDIATVSAFQTPPSSKFSNFSGTTSSYTFTITIFDADSGESGTFTVKGFLKGRFKTSPSSMPSATPTPSPLPVNPLSSVPTATF